MDQLTSSTVLTLISHLEARGGKRQERFGITHTKQVSQTLLFWCSKATACSCYSILQSMIFRYFMTFMTFWLWHFKLEVGCFLLRGSGGIASRFSPAERSHYYMLQKYTATGRVLVDKRRWMIPFLVVVRELDYTPHPKDLGLDSPARWHFIRNVHALRHNYFMLNTQMVEVEWIHSVVFQRPLCQIHWKDRFLNVLSIARLSQGHCIAVPKRAQCPQSPQLTWHPLIPGCLWPDWASAKGTQSK